MQPNLPELVTTKQAAAFLQVGVNTIKKLCNSGQLKATRLGAGWRIPKSELLRLVDIDPDNILSVEVTPELIADLQQAADLIESGRKTDKELAGRLINHATGLKNLHMNAGEGGEQR